MFTVLKVDPVAQIFEKIMLIQCVSVFPGHVEQDSDQRGGLQGGKKAKTPLSQHIPQKNSQQGNGQVILAVFGQNRSTSGR